MRYSLAEQGRTFVIRLEDGEIIHETIERFAREQSIQSASLLVVGGADEGSRLVVGPEEGGTQPVTPMEHILGDVHEIAGVGTLFPDETGRPVLHMHIACGRESSTVTGCVRRGVRVWQFVEVILTELTGTGATRILDAQMGFMILDPAPGSHSGTPAKGDCS
jgi:predicted DNA-binding protein with PD1-like motif